MRGTLSPAVFMSAFEDQELGLMLGDAGGGYRPVVHARLDWTRASISAAWPSTSRPPSSAPAAWPEHLFERLERWNVPPENAWPSR